MSPVAGSPRRLWAHMRELWPRWTLLPPMPWVAWATYQFLRGEVRWELIGAAVLALALAYWSPATKRLLIGIYPACLVGVLYDSMFLFKNVGLTPDNVHDCDLRAHELHWFGVNVGGVRMTLQDYAQAHTVPVLDVIAAIPYGTFIFAIFGYAVFLYFRDFKGLQRFAWAFLLLNVVGFLTYHIYPAAPPWYFHAHGCSVSLASHASEGPNLARVDQMLGVSYFHGMYGRSNDVFGAVPSLHVAYALILLLEGWRHHGWPARGGFIAYFVTMCFASVYLDHHWVIDVLLGLVYCVIIYSATSRVFRSRPETASPRPGTDAYEPIEAR